MNRYWPMLLLLAGVWGASYLFIKVAVEDIAPAPMMAARTRIAAAVLLAFIIGRFGRPRAFEELRGAWRQCLVPGVLNAALPFWLIGGAIGFSIGVSLLAGSYPAARAARLDPIRALRHD